MNTAEWEPVSNQLARTALGWRYACVKDAAVWPIQDATGQWWHYKHNGTGFLRRRISNHY